MSQTAPRTTEFLDQLAAELRALRELTAQRFRPLSDDQLNRRPAPGKWSIGQCLEHLNIIGGHVLPVMARKLKQAQESGSKPAETVKTGFIGRKLIVAMQTPASEKPLQSPQQYAPSGSRLPRTVVEVFSRQLDELANLVEQARTVNANGIRIPNPVIPLLYLRLTDQLELLVVHLKRHVQQAERVLDGVGMVID
ncbi:DinB superfamily protein [Hymenobacter daecheongensis DSM 21074]|uniref:DinB superfamily protein n=1 Tax=Hymenobacter daecheongensis DSM 21074 TaxID=1121955 RepID=A0A1M6CT36_9BACT|nr:DinB family protein [Hymenobacter daecheongensis]SHI64021.1 DinB superfamily protein [Hymenobacter daecheongensis DSM 21074]